MSGQNVSPPLRPLALLWAGLGNVLDGPFRFIQRHIGANRMAYLFLLPNLIVFGTFSFWPMLLNLYIAFTGGTSILISSRPYVGLENFRELLDCASWLEPKTCPVAGYSFWTGLWNTLFFALVQVPVMIGIALLAAITLNREIVARGFWRAVFFYPVMLSPVVVAVTWDWILKRRGILNALLSDVTEGWNRLVQSTFLLPDWLVLADYRPINWLVDGQSGWPMFWAIFVYTWGHLGFYMLILLAGLQAIPKDLYEAAEMDGTPKWRQFWRITLPLLMPTMLVVLVLSLIRAFQVFDEVYVLTGGGPGQATKMVIQHIYETAFTGDAKRYGVAAASSMLLAGLILLLTSIQLVATRKKAHG
jgi:alpha-1,4-digalacturonate transport system permease protein